MIVKLLPMDIPRYWEAIKFCCEQADEVDSKYLPRYLNELLQTLLNDKAQCFARFSEAKELEAMAITRIIYNKQMDENYLYIQCLYSWVPKRDSVWKEEVVFMKRFAQSTGCKYIGTMTRVGRAQDILRSVGFEENTRIYAMRV